MIDFLGLFGAGSGSPKSNNSSNSSIHSTESDSSHLLEHLLGLPAYRGKRSYADNQDLPPVFETVSTPFTSAVGLYRHGPELAPVYTTTDHFVAIMGYAIYRSDTPGAQLHKGPLTAQHLLEAYLNHGSDLPSLLRGSFIACIQDLRSGEVFFVTDPLNIRQWYHYQLPNGTLAVSSQLGALTSLMRAHDLTPRLSQTALVSYILLEYPLGERTMVEGVEAFPPGAISRFNPKSSSLIHTRYYSVASNLLVERAQFSERDGVELLDETLQHTIKAYVSDWKRTAVALTGGYDSRTVMAAIGPERARKQQTYSYGHYGSFDLEIPQRIADKLRLNYKQIHLDETFYENYTDYASRAVAFGDGIGEFTRANYPFAFEHLPQHEFILTGLFGSEFIKPITSEGSFVNRLSRNMLDAAQAGNGDQSAWMPLLDAAIAEAQAKGLVRPEVFHNAKDALSHDLAALPSLGKEIQGAPQRLFHFLSTEGTRQYFMKEIKVERAYVQNLHPFFDIQWLEALVKTPFTWLHQYVQTKDLLASLRTHRVYGALISKRWPALARQLSTHGYRPSHLRSPLFYPLIALEYRQNKKRIFEASGYKLQSPTEKAHKALAEQFHGYEAFEAVFNNEAIAGAAATDFKTFTKLASLQAYMAMHGIEV
jgi:hypothetical protein